jgi:ribonuclease P protein component
MLAAQRGARRSLLQLLGRVTIVSRDLSLGPSGRLRKKGDIARCRDRGTKIHSKHFLILALESSGAESRLAIAVTTKIEKRAVGRNLVKRRLRELFRQYRHAFVRPYDMLFVARRGVQECSFDDYHREIVGALRSHKIIAAA